MRLLHPRFTVTAGAIVIDEDGRVLLLNHRFRGGSGWGIPGGFLESGEQPEQALRREMREEVGLELEDVQIIHSRSFKHVQQIEILFRCRVKLNHSNKARPQSSEIRKAEWFHVNALPTGLPKDQRTLIEIYATR
jgi:mutator protein MutT